MLFLAGAIPSSALAGDIEIATKADAVTLHFDSAVVERRGAVELPPGDSIVIVRNISPKFVSNTMRVKGMGRDPEDGAGVSIGAVTVKRSIKASPQSLDAKALEALSDEMRALNSKKEAAEAQKKAVQNFLDGKDKQPEDLPATWKAVGAVLEEADDKLRAYNKRRDEIIKQVSQAREAAELEGLSEPGYDVFIEMSAQAFTRGEVGLSYQVKDARWLPTYDLRLDSKSKTVAVVRRAQVGQKVGEIWEDVALTLKPMFGAAKLAARDLHENTILLSGDYGQADLTARKVPPPIIAGAPLIPTFAEKTAQNDIGSFDTAYKIEGRAHIPFTGAAKTFKLSESRMSSDVFVKATPSNDKFAFLHARFANVEATPLYAGLAQLYRDGAFVGSQQLKLTGVGQFAEVGFGADQSVSVERIVTQNSEAKKIDRRRVEKSIRFTIDVANQHDFPMDIIIEAQRPISGSTPMIIREANKITPPTERDPDGQTGVVRWRYNYKPLERRKIEYGFVVIGPADKADELPSLRDAIGQPFQYDGGASPPKY